MNRDLEIRDLLQHGGRVPAGGDGYLGAYRARPERQPRFLGRPRREDRLARGRKRHPPADRAGARRLPRRRRHQAVRRAGLLPRDRAAARREGSAHETCGGRALERRRDGHDLHAAHQRRQRPRSSATASTRRRRRHRARSPTSRRPTRTRPSLPSTSSDGGTWTP